MDLNQITMPCRDYDDSVRFYKQLGFRLIVDSPPRYARFETESGTTFSLHSTEGHTTSETVIYFEVDDVDRVVDELTGTGLTFEGPPQDQRWLWREAYLLDPSGNRLCIYHAGANRQYPPWRIETTTKSDG